MTQTAQTDATTVQDRAPSTPDPAAAIAALKERLHTVDESVRRLVVNRPGVALAGAVAGGFIIGRLLSRKR